MDITAVLYAMLALGGIGTIFGAVLTFADKQFHVPSDERAEKIRAALPGANCGACGFAGCDAYAEAVAEGSAKPSLCTPGGKKCAEEIASVLGVEVDFQESGRVAKVICQGKKETAKDRYEYNGYQSCRLAASMGGGPKKCSYACVGLGDCARVCAFGAIRIENGLAMVNEEKCAACGVCESVCPRHVIQMRPKDAAVVVLCQNRDGAKTAREACAKACIACGRCVKECQAGAIRLEDGFAKIDPDKCTRGGECAKVCPGGCITVAK